jgi:hypothetical protein
MRARAQLKQLHGAIFHIVPEIRLCGDGHYDRCFFLSVKRTFRDSQRLSMQECAKNHLRNVTISVIQDPPNLVLAEASGSARLNKPVLAPVASVRLRCICARRVRSYATLFKSSSWNVR